MKVMIDMSGLDKLRSSMEKLGGNEQVSAGELFGSEFMRTHTKFDTWDQMTEAFGVKDTEDVNTAEFDRFVQENTDFGDFNTMKQDGGADYAKRRLEAIERMKNPDQEAMYVLPDLLKLSTSMN